MTDYIYYCDGYKYQLARDYSVLTTLRPLLAIKNEFCTLGTDGILTIREGYAWDGASGPTIQTLDTQRGSLVHDALYQLMREGLLGLEWREAADGMLHSLLLEDGMAPNRAAYYLAGVRAFGGQFADPRSEKRVLRAPLPPEQRPLLFPPAETGA